MIPLSGTPAADETPRRPQVGFLFMNDSRFTPLRIVVAAAGLAAALASCDGPVPGESRAAGSPPAGPASSDPPSAAAPRLVARLGPGARDENSGIVRSRLKNDLFWLINDSGNEPRLFPVHRNGTNWPAAQAGGPPGVLLRGARNVDWEDIAVTASGLLVVADVGNNRNDRRDLTLYILEEPEPQAAEAAVEQAYHVRYPDQQEHPAPRDDFNFDCEAVFTVGETVHLLTKHRSDSRTTLYRLDDPQPDVENTLTKLGDFDTQGQVTAADCSPDGLRLVMTTYRRVWLFERPSVDVPFFQGAISLAPVVSPQIEAVCFADDTLLLLTDELLGTLYELPFAALRPRSKDGDGAPPGD